MAGELLTTKEARIPVNLATVFQRQSSSTIFTEMLVLNLIIGFLDLITGYQLSFFLFYGVPIFIAAWFCGKKIGLLTALISGIIWWWADHYSGHLYLDNWHEAWETCMRLAFFIFASIGSSALRAPRDIAEARIALLEHSRKLEKEIVNISERERERIGQDLHDGLCQYLAAVGCAAATLQNDLARLKLPGEAQMAQEVAELLQGAVTQTRNLARGLVPVETAANGLASALEELVSSVGRFVQIDCRFQQIGDVTIMDERVATHLFRIAQEAINNAMKHAAAKKLMVTLREEAGAIALEICDDGLGISHSAPTGIGMGVNILHYRARAIGAQLKIAEQTSGGTIVSCVLPRAGQTLQPPLAAFA